MPCSSFEYCPHRDIERGDRYVALSLLPVDSVWYLLSNIDLLT
jgi:hypothetical protein